MEDEPRSNRERIRDLDRKVSTHGALLAALLAAVAYLLYLLISRGILKDPAASG